MFIRVHYRYIYNGILCLTRAYESSPLVNLTSGKVSQSKQPLAKAGIGFLNINE